MCWSSISQLKCGVKRSIRFIGCMEARWILAWSVLAVICMRSKNKPDGRREVNTVSVASQGGSVKRNWLMRISRAEKSDSLSFYAWFPSHALAFFALLLLIASASIAHAQSNEWTWMAGSNTVNSSGGETGGYGTEGTPSTSNLPGSRINSVTWTDASGKLWLFGGNG